LFFDPFQRSIKNKLQCSNSNATLRVVATEEKKKKTFIPLPKQVVKKVNSPVTVTVLLLPDLL
jgi:ribosomal protein L13E